MLPLYGDVMANYSITVSNSFNLLGGGRANRWGDTSPSGTTLTWQSAGAATYENVWGAQTDFELQMTKVITNSLGFATDPQFGVTKQIDNSLGFTPNIGKNVTKQIDDTMGLDSSMAQVSRLNRDWYYVYPDNTTNLIAQSLTTYTTGTVTSASWTEQTYTTTTWTGV